MARSSTPPVVHLDLGARQKNSYVSILFYYVIILINNLRIFNIFLILLTYVKEPSDDSMRSPQFTQKLKNLTVNDGEQLELKVKVDGDPEPQITWSKNGKVDT